MSKVPLIHDATKFLKNLREVTKLKAKTPSAPSSASGNQKARTPETNPARRKAPGQRNSHPYYFSAEQQFSPVASTNTSQIPVKPPSKSKGPQIGSYNIEKLPYGLMEQKKISASASHGDVEISEDPSIQLQAHPLTLSANNSFKTSLAESGLARQSSKSQKEKQKQVVEPKKTTSLASVASQVIQSNKTSKLKARKSAVSDSKGRVMTSEEPCLPKIPYQVQRRAISPSRYESRNSKNSSKSPHPFLHPQAMSPEIGQINDDLEIIDNTPKQKTMGTPVNTSKPPKPLKEIKIDIANLIDEPAVNSTNNRASTGRVPSQNLFISHRGDKGKVEKQSRPWAPLSSTPQGSASGASKQRLSLATPKKESVIQKDNARLMSLKSLLTEEEIKQYGDRFPEEFDKVDFLGRGGFALVWLGVEKKTGKKVAIKQILKGGASDSQKKELYFGQLLFEKGGEPKKELKRYPGIENIARFIEHKSAKMDDWHICELGGKTLSKLLFDVRGEFFKSERIYRVKHVELYQAFKSDSHSLKSFIKQMAQILYLLSDLKIVHCDLKPDNILINMNNYTPGKPFDLKIIDFGSAYHWDECGNIGMATPEYMPPEFLDVLISHRTGKSSIEQLAEITHPWSIDVWSLGAIILEIITGVPLWMSLKCRVDIGTKNVLKLGLFAVKGRAYDKIYQKQRSVMEKFQEVLSEYMEYWGDYRNLYDLLSQMMEWDPARRISPAEILHHPYLQEV